MSSDSQLRDAALGFALKIAAGICDEVVETEWGSIYRSPSLPLVWDANFVQVRERGLAPAELRALAEEALAGVGCDTLTIEIEDEEDGRRIAGLCRAEDGWEVETTGYMVWREETKRKPATAAREQPLEAFEELRRQLIEAVLDHARAAEIPQLVEREQRVGAVIGDRWFTAPATEPSAACRLQQLGDLAQIEDVATLPAARGQGLAQSVVLAALAAALELAPTAIFIPVDVNDTPQRLYEKLGFRTIGEATVLHRPA